MGRMRVSRRTFGTSSLGALLLGTLFGVSCGSRTPLTVTEGPPECTIDADCEGANDLCRRVRCNMHVCDEMPVDCDDRDNCTLDRCDPATGQCAHPPATLDADGDGHRAPLPSKRPGETGSCGDDCDDRNASAHPGGVEVCDGADNDCNGTVDDNASLIARGNAVLVSDDANRADPSSLVFDGAHYQSSFTAEVSSRNSIFLTPLGRDGARSGGQSLLTQVEADATGGALVWTGDRFGVTWSDRREARGGINFEVYFNLLNPDRSKRMPDLRVSHADGFSLGSNLAFTNSEFVVVWQDDGQNVFGIDEMYAQRIDLDGNLLGDNVKLTTDGPRGQTAPAIAAGHRSLGVTWVRNDVNAGKHEIMFAPFDYALEQVTSPVSLAAIGASPAIVYNQSQYVLVWYDPAPQATWIYGAVRGDLGEEIVKTKVIAKGARHSRNPAVLPFGDRVLLVWADDRDANSGFELYGQMLDAKLAPLGLEQRLTTAPGDSIDPVLSFGPSGDVGVLFGDGRGGDPQTYFTSLGCTGATTKSPACP
jgi:hypothetical protein